MKLLLTSAGITNDSLKKAFKELVGEEIKTVFIPTASNLEDYDKDWLIRDFEAFEELGYFDIVDISAVPKENWLKRIKKANVIVIGGGDTKYLIEKIKESGFDKELPKFLKTKVYVGISAGSIITAKRVWFNSESVYGDEKGEAPEGLNLIDFNFRPHYNSEYFQSARKEVFQDLSKNNSGESIYACDDNSGLKIIDGKVEIISEGKCDVFFG